MPIRSGFVSIVRRPNAGKSTLVNALLGQKLAIVTHKPQTTRNRIQAVLEVPLKKKTTRHPGHPAAHRGWKRRQQSAPYRDWRGIAQL